MVTIRKQNFDRVTEFSSGSYQIRPVLVLPSLTRFYRVLSSFIEFYRVLPSFNEFLAQGGRRVPGAKRWRRRTPKGRERGWWMRWETERKLESTVATYLVSSHLWSYRPGLDVIPRTIFRPAFVFTEFFSVCRDEKPVRFTEFRPSSTVMALVL